MELGDWATHIIIVKAIFAILALKPGTAGEIINAPVPLGSDCKLNFRHSSISSQKVTNLL